MLKTHMMELLIAGDDHRVLSADADAWQLVDNSVFLPFEQFLTGKSQDVFTMRFAEGFTGWFAVFFKASPLVPYLMQVDFREKKDPKTEPMIRLTIVRADQMIPEYQQMEDQAGIMEAMLALSEDVFFEYDPERDVITLMNTVQSRFSEGERPNDDFFAELRSLCDESEIPLLDEFAHGLKSGTPQFLVSIPHNLFNQDESIPSTMIKGRRISCRDNRTAVVGLMHPQHIRGAADRASLYDPLTGLFNKEQIARMAIHRVDQLHAEGTTIAIVDVDYFKHVNDTYGHQYGDQVLKQIAGIMESVVGNRGVIGRFGGDEFFILFYHATLEELRAYLRSIKVVINATFQGRGALPDSPISVSAGTATYPKDASSYNDLFMVADYCLYLAKEKGRNRYIHYTPEKHPPLEEIRTIQAGGDRGLVNGRDDLPLGDVITQLQFLIRYSNTLPPLSAVLADFAERFRIPLVMLWSGENPARLMLTAGGTEEGESVKDVIGSLLNGTIPPAPQACFHGITVFNRITRLTDEYAEIRDSLLNKDVQSLVIIPFADRNGLPATLVFAALHQAVFWNEQHLPYYRLFADTLTRYALEGAEH